GTERTIPSSVVGPCHLRLRVPMAWLTTLMAAHASGNELWDTTGRITTSMTSNKCRDGRCTFHFTTPDPEGNSQRRLLGAEGNTIKSKIIASMSGLHRPHASGSWLSEAVEDAEGI
ncbi:unnamed protein product, partial [Prorocentrum cordatum]